MLGYLGVMSAKNTAVNILILSTFMSFLLFRRTGKAPPCAWRRIGNLTQLAIFFGAAAIVIFFGIYGYFVEARVRIKFSVPQVLSVLTAMVLITVHRRVPVPRRAPDRRGALGQACRRSRSTR